MSFVTNLDANIQQAILHELDCDGRVRMSTVAVVVRHGIVTLTGHAASWGEKIAAQEVVHRIEGVLDIVNDVDVGLASAVHHDDTDLAQSIRSALRRNTLVPAGQIQAIVWPGIVTLEGEVDSWIEREDAERAVRGVAGVHELRNLIQVKPSSIADEVRTALKNAIARHAEREARNIDLEVRDGVVVLSGRVQSWSEKEMLIGAAKGTRGVRWVEDDLEVVG